MLCDQHPGWSSEWQWLKKSWPQQFWGNSDSKEPESGCEHILGLLQPILLCFPFLKKILLGYSCFTVLYSFLLYSKTVSALNIRMSNLPWMNFALGHHRALSRVPCAIKFSLWSDLKVAQSCQTLCKPMDYSPWNSPGQNTGVGRFFTSWATGKPKNTGVGSLSLPQRTFPTQELNWGLLHCRRILYQLSYIVYMSMPCIQTEVWFF